MKLALLAVPLAPLAAALGALLLRHRLPRRGGWLVVAGSAVSLLVLLALGGQPLGISVTWFRVGDLEMTLGLRLDSLSRWVATLVAGVALLVNLYAVGYMADEEGEPRFWTLMGFFTAAMLALVLADSLLLLFMGWEGVGLASYGLIGFHFREEAARSAALKAFLMTRLGDLGLLLGWLLVLLHLGTTDIGALLVAVDSGALPATLLTTVALLCFLAAVGKSAQLPLTAWLPDAMVGPTPVSALIHSATMVAAGVYLLLRLFPLFVVAPGALPVVLWTGAVTALFAALVATSQYDFKRVLAWSTVSQLGEMMLALGLGGPAAAAFHLTTHGTFKSALFLAAGVTDRATGTRDLRQLGGLAKRLPWTAAAFAVAALALAGFPPFAGFWSEDLILGRALAAGAEWSWLLLLLIALAGIYIGRAGAAVFGGWPGAPAPAAEPPGWLLRVPLLLLAGAAALTGLLLRGPIEELFALGAAGHEPGLWRWLAVAASVAGLGFGAWRVRSAGPVPTLGAWPEVLAERVQAATGVPACVAYAFAEGVERLERAIDRVPRLLAAAAAGIGRGVTVGERGLDASGRAAAGASLWAAATTGRVEGGGFAAGMDGFAHSLTRAGGALRPLQSGKLYLYTLGVFVWVLLVGVGALFLL